MPRYRAAGGRPLVTCAQRGPRGRGTRRLKPVPVSEVSWSWSGPLILWLTPGEFWKVLRRGAVPFVMYFEGKGLLLTVKEGQMGSERGQLAQTLPWFSGLKRRGLLCIKGGKLHHAPRWLSRDNRCSAVSSTSHHLGYSGRPPHVSIRTDSCFPLIRQTDAFAD